MNLTKLRQITWPCLAIWKIFDIRPLFEVELWPNIRPIFDSVFDSIFDSRSSNSTTIHQIYYSASTQLRPRTLSICLDDESRVGTPLRRNLNPFSILPLTLSSQGSLRTEADGSSGSRWKFFRAFGCRKLSLNLRRMSPAAMKMGGSRESVLSMLICNKNRIKNWWHFKSGWQHTATVLHEEHFKITPSIPNI